MSYKNTRSLAFFSTRPLNFSINRFRLKYSNRYFKKVMEDMFNELSSNDNGTCANILLGILASPAILMLATIQTAPIIIAEYAVALLTIVPAIAFATIASPFILLMAIGEFVNNLMTNSNQDNCASRELQTIYN